MKYQESILILLVLAAASMTMAAGTDSYVIKSGKTEYVILLPDDATAGEKYAAQKLQGYIKQISGIELSQISESLYSSATVPCISIGRTALSKEHVSDEQLKGFGDDGYRVFRSDGNIFFIGGRQRGSLYAVYQYLESLGVRWYSPDYTVVPKLSEVPLPVKPFEFKPKFWYRCQWWNNNPSLEWLARMRLNGNNGQTPRIPDSMGGCIITMHSCHSYETLIPAGEHFTKHPDWFALKEDKSRSKGEYCLTNPELRDFVTSRVLTDLRACPRQVDCYWVSQNDGGLSGCFCDRCTAERLAHGGKNRWSANTISFACHIADAIRQEFPKVRIKTLAYSYTKEAPENMTVPDNVLIEICGNFKPDDNSQTKLLRSWFKVAKNISVYTYGGSNYGYWWPYPNLLELGMQPRWALQSGATAFYVQGTALGKGSGLVDLRAYLTARLIWDPSRDVQQEIRDFCDGFYGPAGKYIVQYIDWYSAYVKERMLALYEGWGDAEAWRKWVTRDAMTHCEGLFQKALAAAKDNPLYLHHVRRAYLEVLWALVMLDIKSATDNKPVFESGADASAVRARAKLFGEIMRENGYDKLAEHLNYVPGMNLLDAAARE